ncbi:hypothetical protein KFE25_009922 [Diacronema lutheri]|uniref:Uncharacterized protein n=1 Tax=Diacronema lutheri TaxID=2081491 RepID=A0A8J5XPX3_DIALT|nr:hypothetical protein KFE25_009922 [Diacronema lutheri]
MAELVFATDVPDAELRGSGAANCLHQARDALSRESMAQAELLLPCARGYCLWRGADGGAAPRDVAAGGRGALGEGDAAVCALARGDGRQPCVALARASAPRIEIWRLGVLVEARALPGACRALSWRGALLAAATSSGCALLGHARGAAEDLLLEPRAPTLALAWLDDCALAVAYTEDALGVCTVRLYASPARGMPPADGDTWPPLAAEAVRTITLGAGRVCSMCALPGSSVLALAMTTLAVTLAPAARAVPPPLTAAAAAAAPPAAPAPIEAAAGVIDLTSVRALTAAAGEHALSTGARHELFDIHHAHDAQRAGREADAADAAAAVSAALGGAGDAISAPTAALCLVDAASPGAATAVVPLSPALASPNMLACAQLTTSGRAQRKRWTVAIGSSVRSAIELLVVRVEVGSGEGAAACVSRRAVVELPVRHSCHGLSLCRAELLVLCSRPGVSPSALFSAQYAKRALQLQVYYVRLDDEPRDTHADDGAGLAGHAAPIEIAARRMTPRAPAGVALQHTVLADARAGAPRSDDARRDEALRELTRRLCAVVAAYSVDWAAAPLLSVDEAEGELTVRVRLGKRSPGEAEDCPP